MVGHGERKFSKINKQETIYKIIYNFKYNWIVNYFDKSWGRKHQGEPFTRCTTFPIHSVRNSRKLVNLNMIGSSLTASLYFSYRFKSRTRLLLDHHCYGLQSCLRCSLRSLAASSPLTATQYFPARHPTRIWPLNNIYFWQRKTKRFATAKLNSLSMTNGKSLA